MAELVLYVIAAGVAIRLAMFLLRRFFSVHLKPLEGAALAGAIVAIIAVWVPRGDAALNLGVILLIVAGYSAVKALNQKVRPPAD